MDDLNKIISDEKERLKPLDQEKIAVSGVKKLDTQKNFPAELIDTNAEIGSNAKKFFMDFKVLPAFNPVTRNYSRWQMWKLLFRFKFRLFKNLRYARKIYKKFPERTFLIDFYMENGSEMEFMVLASDGGFNFDNKRYLFDEKTRKVFNTTSGMFKFVYHENWSLPFEMLFPVVEMRDLMTRNLADSQVMQIEFATYPRALYQYMISDVVELVFKGGKIAKLLEQIKFRQIIIMVLIALAIVILYMKINSVQKDVKELTESVITILNGIQVK